MFAECAGDGNQERLRRPHETHSGREHTYLQDLLHKDNEEIRKPKSISDRDFVSLNLSDFQ